MSEVDRILAAPNHFFVLDFDTVEYLELAAVRKQYKALARLVHPDKCSEQGAEDAFKKLSIAYECLADEGLQYNYLAKLTGSKKRPRPTESSKKSKHQKHHQSPPYRPTRPRTAEEIYADFLREEERQAETEFLKRGFERNYDTNSYDKRPPSPPPVHSEDFIDEILASGLENKQAKWTQFAKPQRHNQAQPSQPPQPPQPTTPRTESACCLVCRRKFLSHAHLERHEKESKLHAENLAKAADRPSTDLDPKA
ncbi:hypothetical protein AC1031_019329 [Aphanomyces cochlioides]|nr:hypothetical protein AC1031_019329 [Aphanomyces cochlioides]